MTCHRWPPHLHCSHCSHCSLRFRHSTLRSTHPSTHHLTSHKRPHRSSLHRRTRKRPSILHHQLRSRTQGLMLQPSIRCQTIRSRCLHRSSQSLSQSRLQQAHRRERPSTHHLTIHMGALPRSILTSTHRLTRRMGSQLQTQPRTPRHHFHMGQGLT